MATKDPHVTKGCNPYNALPSKLGFPPIFLYKTHEDFLRIFGFIDKVLAAITNTKLDRA